MSKEFRDFTFMGKSLSDLTSKYMGIVSFDDADNNLAMEREMERGERNKYRVEPNYYGAKWSENLEFELDIIKDICTEANTDITKSEIREITRWLTSPQLPQWIKFEYDTENDDVKHYYGWFKNIETWCVGGITKGLKLHFECTTPFGYTDKIVNQYSVETLAEHVITNDSDELYDYCYPTIHIYPNGNSQMYICNLSDATILEEGVLEPSDNDFNNLLNVVETYALYNGYTVRYTGTGAHNIVSLCDNTAVQFYLIDRYAKETKHTAFYIQETSEYKIITDGFMYMNLYEDLEIDIDCQKLMIMDSIGRMITYDKLGISDVDNMYWLRFINGDNTLLLYGNAEFTITHRESRKVGE